MENFGTGGMIAIGLFALFIMFKTDERKKPWENSTNPVKENDVKK